MSSNTKIVVLKSKELIYAGIFLVLGIVLVLLLFYMFSGGKDSKDNKKENMQKETTAQSDETTETMCTYQPGVYTSQFNLGGTNLELSATVDTHAVTHLEISNLDETVTAMYPLVQPSLDEINQQLEVSGDLNSVTYSGDNQYTSILILETAKETVKQAKLEE